MVAEKFLKKGAGILQEAQAIDTSAGASSAGKIACLDEDGRFNENMMPAGVSG